MQLPDKPLDSRKLLGMSSFSEVTANVAIQDGRVSNLLESTMSLQGRLSVKQWIY